MMRKIIIVIACLLSYFLTDAQQFTANWESIDSRPVPSWFKNAKFGIFIHWGVYAVPAYSPTARDGVGVYDRYAEHYWRRLLIKSTTQHYFTEFHNRVYGPNVRYEDFTKDFKAEMFQPDQWADLFAKSGARYVVLTSKHHDGFALWPTAYSKGWNAMDVGPQKDLLGDLTKAVRNKGLRMGYYYSLLEWYHPQYKKETIDAYVNEHMLPQMKELVTTYRPDVLWTDGEWDYTSDVLQSPRFVQWLYNESPIKNNVVINDRWGKETRSRHGGFFTTEYDLVHNGDARETAFERPWEECRGMAGSFGYNRNETAIDYSTSGELIHVLINKVGRGGNLLLNIGPTADGRIPELMQQRLLDMGDWLKINGEAIYDSETWEHAPAVKKDDNVFFTRKGTDLFVLLTSFPKKAITIQHLGKPVKVECLGQSEIIPWKQKGKTITISPWCLTPATDKSKWAWVIKLSGAIQ